MKAHFNFICEECTVIFQVYGSKRKKGRYFCPYCGENTDVHPYEAERYSSSDKKIRWKQEELELVKECISGNMQPYQVAIMIGRSTNAVNKKVQRMREKGDGEP